MAFCFSMHLAIRILDARPRLWKNLLYKRKRAKMRASVHVCVCLIYTYISEKC